MYKQKTKTPQILYAETAKVKHLVYILLDVLLSFE